MDRLTFVKALPFVDIGLAPSEWGAATEVFEGLYVPAMMCPSLGRRECRQPQRRPPCRSVPQGNI